MSVVQSYGTHQKIIDMFLKPSLVGITSYLLSMLLDASEGYGVFLGYTISKPMFYTGIGIITSLINTPISLWAIPHLKAKWQNVTDHAIQIIVHGVANAILAFFFFPSKLFISVAVAILSETLSQYVEAMVIPLI
jgi:mannitol-specific phosphotransferase system IIBC component